MKEYEELLQRCFDNDLDDKELKTLFAEMSKNASLRASFCALQSMRQDLHAIPVPEFPRALDERVRSINRGLILRMFPNAVPVHRFVEKKISFSVPAIAASILLLLFGSYYAATRFFVPQPRMEYVYVVEMPAYVVQSSYQEIKNN
ncbi:MAG: hypothetical protein WCW40_09625 [Bacteroidota bacterium]